VTNHFLIALSALSFGLIGGLLITFGAHLFIRLDRLSEARRAEEPGWVSRLSATSFVVGTVIVVSTIAVVELVGGGGNLIRLSLGLGLGFSFAAEVELARSQRNIEHSSFDIFPRGVAREQDTVAG
jgi:hypothetical protein